MDEDLAELRLLMLAQLKPACGNYSTACRIRNHFESRGITCHLRDSDSFSSETEFDCFMTQHGVNALLVLHAYRGGRWLYDIAGRLSYSIPYAVIYGGTDLNESDMDDHRLQVISHVVSHASFLVVFSGAMRDKALSNSAICMKLNNNLESLTAEAFTVIPQAPVVEPTERNICSEIRLQHGIPKDAHVFTLVTGIRPVKDPLFMVNLFSEWQAAKDQKAYLLILGPELDKSCSEAFHEAVSSTSSVVYLGVHPPADTHAIVRDSLALLSSSRSEGMSSAILEAMALGVPVIARSIPGNTAIISDRQNGFLFQNKEEFMHKAEELMSNPGLHKQLSESGLEYISEHHSIEMEQQAYISLANGLNKLRPRMLPTNQNLANL